MSCRPYALRKGNPLPSTLSLWTAEQTCETRWLFVVCRTPHWGTSSSNTLSLHCPQSLVNKDFLAVCDAVNKGSYCGKQGCFQCMQPPLSITYYKNRCENLHQISRYYLISAKWDESWALSLSVSFTVLSTYSFSPVLVILQRYSVCTSSCALTYTHVFILRCTTSSQPHMQTAQTNPEGWEVRTWGWELWRRNVSLISISRDSKARSQQTHSVENN